MIKPCNASSFGEYVFVILLLFVCCPEGSFAQKELKLGLYDIVEQAQTESPGAKLAQTQKKVAQYEFLTYKSDFNPQIYLYGNAPVYNKEFLGVRQPDGSILFQSISQSNNALGISLSQRIAFTGGDLSLNTDLTRFDDFKLHQRQYSSTPVFLRLTQPIFGVNELKWKKRIEPLKLEESDKQFLLTLEDIALETVTLCFNLMDAENNIATAENALSVAEINYNIERKRIDLGTTTQDKLLQLQLQILRSKQSIAQSHNDYLTAQLALKTFLGKKGDEKLVILNPQQIPSFQANVSDAIRYAKRNRPEFVGFERKKLEAQRAVAIAKAAKQEINLTASLGLNSTGESLSSVYRDVNIQQRFNLGFNLPILDWGRRKARYNTSKTLEQLTIANNEFGEASILQEITTLINSIDLASSNMSISLETDSVASRRFEIAKSQYKLGKLSVIEFRLAQTDKDDASRQYIKSLRDFWKSYYQLRKVTLFDFVLNRSLVSSNDDK